MTTRFIIAGVISIACLLSCSPSRVLKSDQTAMEKSSPERDFKGQRELIDYLRTTPGVEVRGGGANLLVLVRGAKSINGNNNPLYVVDGVIMGYNYYHAASAADRFMIDKVVVLPPPRSARYGSQGQNGVIEVTTRNVL